MKKAFLYLFLFSYSIVVCKPVMPSIADTIAHIFWYSEHIAKVHYENGKYHVHLEYQQAAKDHSPEKESSLPKSESLTEHLLSFADYSFNTPSCSSPDFFIASVSIDSVQLDNDFPPPKL